MTDKAKSFKLFKDMLARGDIGIPQEPSFLKADFNFFSRKEKPLYVPMSTPKLGGSDWTYRMFCESEPLGRDVCNSLHAARDLTRQIDKELSLQDVISNAMIYGSYTAHHKKDGSIDYYIAGELFASFDQPKAKWDDQKLVLKFKQRLKTSTI